MNILIASSEVTPFAKTGGLADVCGALPIELANLGCDPIVMLPAYRQVHNCDQPITPTDISLDIPIGDRTVSGRLLESRLPDSDVRLYLVEQNDYYDPNIFTPTATKTIRTTASDSSFFVGR